MPEKALTIVEPHEVAKVTQKDLDDYLFGSGTKLSEPQKKLFYGISLAYNLNPLKREVYAIPYGERMSIITGYEVYLKRAERTGKLDGWEAKVESRNGELVATCTIYRKDRQHPVIIEAWEKEYNQGNQMWKSKPRTMLRKVAIAQAFRMAFPDELGGMPYTTEEVAAGETQELEFVPLEDLTEKAAAEDEARKDLEERKSKATAYLAKKGKAVKDCEEYLKRSYADWEQADLDALKTWAKDKFKEAPADDIPL